MKLESLQVDIQDRYMAAEQAAMGINQNLLSPAEEADAAIADIKLNGRWTTVEWDWPGLIRLADHLVEQCDASSASLVRDSLYQQVRQRIGWYEKEITALKKGRAYPPDDLSLEEKERLEDALLARKWARRIQAAMNAARAH